MIQIKIKIKYARTIYIVNPSVKHVQNSTNPKKTQYKTITQSRPITPNQQHQYSRPRGMAISPLTIVRLSHTRASTSKQTAKTIGQNKQTSSSTAAGQGHRPTARGDRWSASDRWAQIWSGVLRSVGAVSVFSRKNVSRQSAKQLIYLTNKHIKK